MILSSKKKHRDASKNISKLAAKAWKSIDFSSRLKSRREELGFSQENLSKAIGVSSTTVQNYESGQYPKGEHAISLAQALECSLDWLLMGREPMKGEPESAEQTQHSAERLDALEKRVAELEAENKRLAFELYAKESNLQVYKEAMETLKAVALKGGAGTTDAPEYAPCARIGIPINSQYQPDPEDKKNTP